MPLTREMLEARLAELRRAVGQQRDAIAQAQANLHATEGAAQECEHWLAALAERGTTRSEA